LAVRRAVSFSDAVYDGKAEVEGVQAIHASTRSQIDAALEETTIALIVDPRADIVTELSPLVLVDAIMAKRNLGTQRSDAPAVIALGPGFLAGRDAHAVIETQRGHNLGRIIWEGEAEPDTCIPGAVLGHTSDRVLRAPADGEARWRAHIGDLVEEGEILGHVAGQPVLAPFAGALRGAIREGLSVPAGLKIGDVDPRGDASACFTISDKARAIAGSTLQAALMLMRTL
jgi:xanthine dehydrogenase accessory factor